MNETSLSPQIIKANDHSENPTLAFAKDVLKGLNSTPKRLSSVYFYDERGSQLFEEICELEEYYLTRKETEILQQSAAEIISKLPHNTHLIELGSGNSTKTRILLEAALARFSQTQYSPIDVSAEILTNTVNDLSQQYPQLKLNAVTGRYEFGMDHILKSSTTPNCIIWLGSSIGNLTRAEAAQFLRDASTHFSKDDSLILGIDLRKHAEILEPAYDDASGVTAAFNLNLLDRLNNELGGTFDRRYFHHQAVYNVEAGRIEMYLVSDRDQDIEIKNIGVTISFKKNEQILTEYSYKYSHAEINDLAEAAGFTLEHQWLDDQGWFSLNYFKPQNNTPELRA